MISDPHIHITIVTLKSGLDITQSYWKLYHSTDCVWFPISVF